MASANSAPVKTTDFVNVQAREIDFVSRFSTAFESLRDLLSVSSVIAKPAGANITIKKAVADAALEQSVAEGVEIAYTNYNITESVLSTITMQKYRKGVTLEAIEKYGYDTAVAKTDTALLNDLQAKITGDLFSTMRSAATGTSTGSTWQAALAKARGEVIEQAKASHISAGGAVAFVNVNDFFGWEGSASITVQTAFGLQYIENFMNYSKVILCAGSEIPANTVIATAIDNLDVYYVDAAQSDFAKAGLQYTTDGENNILGVHIGGNYGTAVADTFAIMGVTIAPEYANVLRKVTVGE